MIPYKITLIIIFLSLKPYFCIMQKKIVITGGPGTGKTTLINELINRGYSCMEEISRQVTLQAQKDGIEQLFLEKPLLFSELLLGGRVKQFHDANTNDSDFIFFDRGIPDVFAYMNYMGSEYPSLFVEKSNDYKYDQVFIMPPWEEIYITDNERYESFEQALAIYNHLKKGYQSVGYQVIEIPKGTIEFRLKFLLDHIQ